jgi:uncharacterized membrane protein
MLLLKALHLLGVVWFLGNIIVTGYWLLMADRSGDRRVKAFAMRQVIRADYMFTLPGVAVILITGWWMLHLMERGLFDLLWAAWGLALFAASGLIWILFLVPIQRRLQEYAGRAWEGEEFPADHRRLLERWYVWGLIATLLPLANLFLMTYKL